MRVTERTRETLTRLSRRQGVSTADYLEELVSRREQDELLEAMNEAYARQRDDSAAWGVERAERGAWETSLLDGLSDL